MARKKEICYCKHCVTMFLVVIDEMETGDRSSFARRATGSAIAVLRTRSDIRQRPGTTGGDWRAS